MPDFPFLTGANFIRAIRKLGRKNGVRVVFVASEGAGSHGTLYYGSAKTTVKDRKKEIGPGLLAKMHSDLGLAKGDI